jgi:hypothetical protein
MTNSLYTLSEAATELRISIPDVRRLIATGALDTRILPGRRRVRVTGASITRYVTEPGAADAYPELTSRVLATALYPPDGGNCHAR